MAAGTAVGAWLARTAETHAADAGGTVVSPTTLDIAERSFF
jgi:hypothetical protein